MGEANEEKVIGTWGDSLGTVVSMILASALVIFIWYCNKEPDKKRRSEEKSEKQNGECKEVSEKADVKVTRKEVDEECITEEIAHVDEAELEDVEPEDVSDKDGVSHREMVFEEVTGEPSREHSSLSSDKFVIIKDTGVLPVAKDGEDEEVTFEIVPEVESALDELDELCRDMDEDLDANLQEKSEMTTYDIDVETGQMTTYDIDVETGDKRGAGTDANVFIILFGDKCSTEKIPLKESKTHKKMFERNHVDSFTIESVDVGKIIKITIGHDNKGGFAGWYLKNVVISNATMDDKLTFVADRWLDLKEDDKKLEVDLCPLNSKVEVTTSVTKEEGDHGHIDLDVPSYDDMEEITVDVQAELHDEDESFLQKLDEDHGDNTHDLLNAPSAMPTPEICEKQVEDVEEKAKRKESSTVDTSSQSDEDVNREEVMKLFKRFDVDGDGRISIEEFKRRLKEDKKKRKKEKKRLKRERKAAEAARESESVSDPAIKGKLVSGYDEKDITSESSTEKLDEVGAEAHVDVAHEEVHHVSKEEVDDAIKASSSTLPVAGDKHDDVSADGPEDKTHQAEVKNTEPDTMTYIIEVKTGDVKFAGTDAHVFIILYGDRCYTDKLNLKKSMTHKSTFERDHMDRFQIETSNVGNLEKIRIGHDNKGGLAGWYLDDVTVHAPSVDAKWTCPANRWLDKHKGDGKLEIDVVATKQ